MALSKKKRALLQKLATRTVATNPLTVVILGRPNVGKSTLFNRLISSRRALVHNLPGVTRDRVQRETEWYRDGEPHAIRIVDTGGLGGEQFSKEIEDQVTLALSEADLALFVLDGRAGITPLDRELIQGLRRRGVLDRIPLIGVVNKVDAEQHESLVHDFHSLKIEPLLTISAEHNRGIDDLKLEVLRIAEEAAPAPTQAPARQSLAALAVEAKHDALSQDPEQMTESMTEHESHQKSLTSEPAESSPESKDPGVEIHPDRLPRIAIVGRPNVGKSTLVNALLGEKRMITSPIAGTTVDAVDSVVELDGSEFVLVDTAGIRRKSRTEQGVEVLSVVQAKKALERADIACLVLDASVGVTDQDEKIGGMIEAAGCAVILVINKWDTQRENKKFTRQEASERLRAEMGFLNYAPIIFTSAIEGRGLRGLGELAQNILHQRSLKVPTSEFSKFIRAEALSNNPKNCKFYLCHQTGRNPPTFVCHVSDPRKIHFSMERHILNSMRERWGFMGSPLRLHFLKASSTRPPRQARH
jgi:GTP-binding protein